MQKLKCFFGVHEWIDDPYEGCYGGTVIGYKCKWCGEDVPHWTDKGRKILKKRQTWKQ